MYQTLVSSKLRSHCKKYVAESRKELMLVINVLQLSHIDMRKIDREDPNHALVDMAIRFSRVSSRATPVSREAMASYGSFITVTLSAFDQSFIRCLKHVRVRRCNSIVGCIRSKLYAKYS